MGSSNVKPMKSEEVFNDSSNLVDNYLKQQGNYKVKATCSYVASRKINDISFKKGEIMFVTWRYNDVWLEVIKEKDHIKGLVPWEMVRIIDDGPESMKGWRNIQRREAKYLLLNPYLKRGTYILRPSSKKNCYALSIRDYNKNKQEYVIKNFLIKTLQSETGERYLTHIKVYPNIASLINNFKVNGIGVNRTRLTDPIPDHYQCFPLPENNQFNQQNIEFLSQTYVDKFDLSQIVLPEVNLNIKIEKNPCRLSLFMKTIKMKFKYQCRKSRDYLRNSKKNKDLKM